MVSGCTWLKLHNSDNEKSDKITLQEYNGIVINAIDLSEDLSRFSTKNDEILVLIYALKDSSSLQAPLLSSKHFFDAKKWVDSLSFGKWRPMNDQKLIFFFIEQDSDLSIEQIDPVIRVHYKQLTKYYNDNNYSKIEKYLGDEDLLGVKVLENINTNFKFSGIHKLDKYEYQIKISYKE